MLWKLTKENKGKFVLAIHYTAQTVFTQEQSTSFNSDMQNIIFIAIEITSSVYAYTPVRFSFTKCHWSFVYMYTSMWA